MTNSTTSSRLKWIFLLLVLGIVIYCLFANLFQFTNSIIVLHIFVTVDYTTEIKVTQDSLPAKTLGILQGIETITGRVLDPNFLSGKLALRVVNIIPSNDKITSNNEDPIEISGTTPITIVFNRAVIALGSDFDSYRATTTKDLMLLDKTNKTVQMPFVFEGLPEEGIPGKFRWVTTSICRFDPDIQWPTDLKFRVRVKEDLVAFDGTKLSNTKMVHYQTKTLSMYIASVESKLANQLTDNNWDPLVGQSDSVVECPPDAEINISFSNTIDSESVIKALKIVPDSSGLSKLNPFADTSNEIPFSASSKDDRSIVIRLDGKANLKVDQRYKIILQRGSKYHKYSGPLSEDIHVKIAGLRSFKFPFLNRKDLNTYVKHLRYHLW